MFFESKTKQKNPLQRLLAVRKSLKIKLELICKKGEIKKSINMQILCA